MNAVLLFVLFLAEKPAPVCPFLNESTAAGILGGAVEFQATVTDKDKGDATCGFTRKTDDSSLSLRIEVKSMHDWRLEFPSFLAQCGAHADAVRGIGNEAVACAGEAEGHKRYDQILSRVRERSLLVRVTNFNSQAADGTLRKKTVQAADLVSGNLF